MDVNRRSVGILRLAICCPEDGRFGATGFIENSIKATRIEVFGVNLPTPVTASEPGYALRWAAESYIRSLPAWYRLRVTAVSAVCGMVGTRRRAVRTQVRAVSLPGAGDTVLSYEFGRYIAVRRRRSQRSRYARKGKRLKKKGNDYTMISPMIRYETALARTI